MNTPAKKTTKPCPFCKRPLRCTEQARAENPFCAKCLERRLERAATAAFLRKGGNHGLADAIENGDQCRADHATPAQPREQEAPT